jgi:hypothetical protein
MKGMAEHKKRADVPGSRLEVPGIHNFRNVIADPMSAL